MTRSRLYVLGAIAFAAFVVLLNTVYVVKQTDQALIVRFGEPVRVVNADGDGPGLKVKAPFVEQIVMLDKRNLALEVDREELIAADQERLVVDAFVRYRISDPLQFYRTLRDERVAADRLERLVNSSLRQVLGSAQSGDIISGRRAGLMQAIRQDMDRRARGSRLGVQIVDVRIKRADLPEANRAAVFARMQTAREQEAAQIRAIGEQQRREIIAQADKEVAVTLAEATEYAETVRGEGDAARTRLFAQSYGRDPSFAQFYRNMQALEGSLANGDTTMVISPEGEFWRYFQRGPSGR